MLVNFSTLFAAVATLAAVNAAPASNASASLTARDCAGFGLEAQAWVSVRGLDKGENPDWQWGGWGPHHWRFPFSVADGYTVEHFEVIRYKENGVWLGGLTPGLQMAESWDCRLLAPEGLPPPPWDCASVLIKSKDQIISDGIREINGRPGVTTKCTQTYPKQ